MVREVTEVLEPIPTGVLRRRHDRGRRSHRRPPGVPPRSELRRAGSGSRRHSPPPPVGFRAASGCASCMLRGSGRGTRRVGNRRPLGGGLRPRCQFDAARHRRPGVQLSSRRSDRHAHGSRSGSLRLRGSSTSGPTERLAGLLRELRGRSRMPEGSPGPSWPAARCTTPSSLAEVVRSAIPARHRRRGGHPAKRSFQALRIAVNDELAPDPPGSHAGHRPPGASTAGEWCSATTPGRTVS